MSGYLQIEGDPTQWWLVQPITPNQLTGQALTVQVQAPLAGSLLLSANSASVAVMTSQGAEPTSLAIPNAAIYVPTAAGPSAGYAGYELPASADLATLAGEITTLMNNGSRQIIAIGAGGSGGLVLNGATLSFVVLCPATVAAGGGGATGGGVMGVDGAMPHD
jgi:hypothetical protein